MVRILTMWTILGHPGQAEGGTKVSLWPSGCSPGCSWGPSSRSLATHLPLTCHSLATDLPLTCPSLAPHLPSGPNVGNQGLNSHKKNAQRSVLVRARLENSFPRSPETIQCLVFTINTICSEGSESPQECDIRCSFGLYWGPRSV